MQISIKVTLQVNSFHYRLHLQNTALFFLPQEHLILTFSETELESLFGKCIIMTQLEHSPVSTS